MSQPYIYHRIENGDTLESIAKQYGVSTYRLSRLNSGITNAELKAGRFIVIGQIESDRIDEVEQQRQEAIEKQEEDKKKQEEEKKKPIDLPDLWLSDEQIRKMALEQVPKNTLELEALAGEKKRNLQKITEQRTQNQDDYYKKLRQINADVDEQQEDFVQDAIKQGIGRSSILQSVKDEYQRQGDKRLSELNRQASLDIDKLESQQREIIRQYNQDVAQANEKYQQQLDKAMQSIKEKNQEANIDVTVSNGLDHAVQYQIADRLLGTLNKSAAADYLKKNEQVLIDAWGKEAVDKLYKKYK